MRHKTPKLAESTYSKAQPLRCAGPAKKTRVAYGNSSKVSVCTQQRESEFPRELHVICQIQQATLLSGVQC